MDDTGQIDVFGYSGRRYRFSALRKEALCSTVGWGEARTPTTKLRGPTGLWDGYMAR